MTRLISKLVYILFGSIATIFGLTSLLFPNKLHPHSSSFFEFRHNLREFGAAAVFVGLMSLWCAFNYERSRTIHYLLTLFNLLVAAIHWYDFLQGDLPITSPLFNSIGFFVFGALAILRTTEPSNPITVTE